MRCLVTGATGYVGGRLVPRLLAAGHEVRCLTRSARRLRDIPWSGSVEIIEGDVGRPASLEPALAGVDTAYYLVHALGRAGFERLDRIGAVNFSDVAADLGTRRIIYLGGPEPVPHRAGGAGQGNGGRDHPPIVAGGDDRILPSGGMAGHTSAHLRSRSEVADILLASKVPTIALRAAVIIGSGSASFEMLRYLTERLPVMVTPRWVANRIQPIAIRDVLRYLVACAEPGTFPADLNRAFDIGGPDVLTYEEMMRRYAAVAGLRERLIIPVRALTPSLSAHWVGLVTPVPNAIARPLVASLIHEAICHEHDIAEYIPDPPEGLTGFDDAVRLALQRVRDAQVETRWADATWPGAPTEPMPPLPPTPPTVAPLADRPPLAVPSAEEPLATDPAWSGGTIYSDVRQYPVQAPPDQLWRVIEAIGGENGWYSFPLAWAVRGGFDRLIGGVGLRRGRRHPHHLYVGEALDFWRVEEIVPGELLRLRAEMRLPGRAWLEMRVAPEDGQRSRYIQRAVFLPRGLSGHAYWASVWPFHSAVFGGMARRIAQTAERRLPADEETALPASETASAKAPD